MDAAHATKKSASFGGENNVNVTGVGLTSASSYGSLETLPSEVLLHICAFLDAPFLTDTFALICKQFQNLVNEENFWKLRIKKRWPKKYPAIRVKPMGFTWKAACLEREKQYKMWIDPEKSIASFTFRHGMFGIVDSIQLMKAGSLLAVGSRDRHLNIVDINKLDCINPLESVREAHLFTKTDAHKGWIWSMASVNNTLATGSWDMHISFWDVAAGGAKISQIKCRSAVLCLHYEPNMMVAGCFDNKVYHIDPRAPAILAQKCYHKKPILDVAANTNYIMTASEDSTIALYDRRAGKVLSTVQLPSFPLCMSYSENQLWVGDKTGFVHVVGVDCGKLDMVETYNVGHSGKVTGIHYTLGALYTCSSDHSVCVHEPSAHPNVITSFYNVMAEANCLHYSNGVLVSGYNDVSVGIWKSKTPPT